MQLKKSIVATCATAIFVCSFGQAQDFQTYPGAKLDTGTSRQASSRRTQSQVYTTADAFENVYAFYNSRYKEFPWRLPKPKLPSGKEIQWAYFILGRRAGHYAFKVLA